MASIETDVSYTPSGWFRVVDGRVLLGDELANRLGVDAELGFDAFARVVAPDAEFSVRSVLDEGGRAHVAYEGATLRLEVGPRDDHGSRPAILVATDSEPEVHRYHQRFDTLARHLPLGVQILDSEGRPTFANRELHRLLGFTNERVDAELAASLIHADDLERVASSFATFRDSDRDAWTERYRVISADGTVRVVESGCYRIRARDGSTIEFVSYLEDIDASRAYAEVSSESDTDGTALAVGRVGHWSWDSTTDRLTLSETMQEIYGIESGEPFTAETVEGFIPTEQRFQVRREVERSIEENRSWEAEHDIVTPAGELRRIISRGRSFSADGAIRLVGMAIDVTAQREREQQVRQAEKLRAIGQLASGVAHDFNNMLGAIMGNATVLSEEVPPGLQRPVAEIQIAAERVTQLTRKLLTFSRHQELERAPNDVHELLDEVFALVAHSFTSGLEVRRRLRAERTRVMCDPSQIQSAFLNIVVNARDAMQNGGGLLEIETRNVEVQDADWIEIVFRDNGPGMSEDTRRRAFEPFFTTRRDDGGTGLGLSATYGAVLRHGGTIDLDSREGEGTLFTVRFRTLESPDSNAHVVHRSSKDESGSGRTIWLVDDEPLMRSLATRVLERASYQVVAFESAEEVLDALDDGAPDVFLIDHHMPSMSGLHLIEELRERRVDLPIVMVTGNSFEISSEWAERLRVESIVEKPYAVGDLLGAVETAK